MRFRSWYRVRRLRAFGATVSLHWSVFAGVAVLAVLSMDSPLHATVAVVSYLSVVAVHELGHAYIAKKRGLDVVAIRIAFFHGTCEFESPDYEWDEVLVAWGGVLAQLVVALPILLIAVFLNDTDLGYFNPAIVILGYLNLLFALVNLTPAEPFDGARAWRIVALMRAARASRSAINRARKKWGRR